MVKLDYANPYQIISLLFSNSKFHFNLDYSNEELLKCWVYLNMSSMLCLTVHIVCFPQHPLNIKYHMFTINYLFHTIPRDLLVWNQVFLMVCSFSSIQKADSGSHDPMCGTR